MICPFCRHEFEEAEGWIACDGCVARKGCGLVRCPSCGFESAREPALLTRLRYMFTRRRIPGVSAPLVCLEKTTAVTLADLKPGETAVIERFSDGQHIRKFLSLGILPGMNVTLVKDFPAIVLRIGYSEFALDHSLAYAVHVHRLSPADTR
jgi:Fe2+ transport system protein FeoA